MEQKLSREAYSHEESQEILHLLLHYYRAHNYLQLDHILSPFTSSHPISLRSILIYTMLKLIYTLQGRSFRGSVDQV
jgi:hypothetical protein